MLAYFSKYIPHYPKPCYKPERPQCVYSMILTVCLKLFQTYSKVHLCDDWSGLISWPTLMDLGDTYVYPGKECGWEYELSFLNLSRLDGKWQVKSVNGSRWRSEQPLPKCMFFLRKMQRITFVFFCYLRTSNTLSLGLWWHVTLCYS